MKAIDRVFIATILIHILPKNLDYSLKLFYMAAAILYIIWAAIVDMKSSRHNP